MKLLPDAMPTVRQGTTLTILATRPRPVAARDVPVRSDVLWRMEEASWVARNAHNQWSIRPAGEQALERWRNRS
jgi:hypothetical protein